MSEVNGYVILSYNYDNFKARNNNKYIDIYKLENGNINKKSIDDKLIEIISDIDLNKFDKKKEIPITGSDIGELFSGYMILLKDGKYFFYNLQLNYDNNQNALNNYKENLNEITDGIIEKIKKKDYFLTKYIDDEIIKDNLIELIRKLIKLIDKNGHGSLIDKLNSKIYSIKNPYTTKINNTVSALYNGFNKNLYRFKPGGKTKNHKKTKNLKNHKKKTHKRNR